MYKVWIDWSNGTEPECIPCYWFKTLGELNAFLEGITAFANANNSWDFVQIDTKEELIKYKKDHKVDNSDSVQETY